MERPDPKFAIIGAGMSGILAAIKLQEAGVDFTIFEKADNVGGTWRENTYPGIACDVPSHIYSYSFELNPDWNYFASPGSEVQSYFEMVTDKYGLDAHIRFGETVTRAEWDADGTWQVETSTGFSGRFDWVIAATGVLHHPKRPDIAGLDDFDGQMFHSARWDHDVELDGKRIGLIGTGSTGTQITGSLGPRAGKLSVFQRTAQWVVPLEQTAYSEEDKSTFRTDTDTLRALHEELSTSFHTGFASQIIDADTPMTSDLEAVCNAQLETIADEQLREKLRPDYTLGCKRLVVSHNFYDAIQSPTVDLITEGIERIEAGGIRTADGVLHEVDVIVLATGFHVDRFMRPMDILGVDGVVLDDVWSERPSAYLALGIHGFPNFFMLNGPNSPVGNFSLIATAEKQMSYIMQLVELWRSGQAEFVHPTNEAAARFDDERVEAAKQTVWATGCRSWYLDDRGIPFAWPFSFDRFSAEMAEPKLGDYVTQ